MSISPRTKIKVFLDTNIIIQGRKLSGSEILKKLSKDGKIKLFVSPDVFVEQQRFSWKLDKQRNEFLGVHKDYDEEFFAKMEEFRRKESKLKNQVKEELSYWKKCGIEYCKSTFERLIHIAAVPGLVQLFVNEYGDINSEILHFGQLQTRYHIELLDAVHLMQAQGSQMDWFITEDRKLIKKANRV